MKQSDIKRIVGNLIGSVDEVNGVKKDYILIAREIVRKKEQPNND